MLSPPRLAVLLGTRSVVHLAHGARRVSVVSTFVYCLLIGRRVSHGSY
jgi:hypothetical protein